MFVDSVELILSSGKGGAGSVSFWREKFVTKVDQMVEMVEMVEISTSRLGIRIEIRYLHLEGETI